MRDLGILPSSNFIPINRIVSKKARAQEILAEMLGRESKYIVEKVLHKALDDTDDDQMAWLRKRILDMGNESIRKMASEFDVVRVEFYHKFKQ